MTKQLGIKKEKILLGRLIPRGFLNSFSFTKAQDICSLLASNWTPGLLVGGRNLTCSNHVSLSTRPTLPFAPERPLACPLIHGTGSPSGPIQQ